MDVFLRINGYRLNQKPDEIYNQMMQLFNEKQFDVEHLEVWLKGIIVEA
jgi:prophage maintenance system killer protein